MYLGIPLARSLADQLNGLSAASLPKADALSVRYRWGIVANAAVDQMIRLMFAMNLRPENLVTINLKEQLYHRQFAPEAANKPVTALSYKLGGGIAVAIT